MLLSSSRPSTLMAQGHQTYIGLSDVGVRYLLLTEDQRTIKGRLLKLLQPASPAGQFWALRNINVEINPGEVVGVVGRNGSGKSTLLRAISGIIHPTTGAVRVQSKIGPLLELGGAFNGELTGRENAYLHGALLKFSREQIDSLIPQISA